MKKNLVIWDFDGVIADSEKVWIKNRQESLNIKFNLNWDFKTANKYLGGMSDKTKKQVLDNMGYHTDDDFWNEQIKLDMTTMRQHGLDITPYIEELIKKLPKQCIATGGVLTKTKVKLEVIGFWNKYFNENNVFTADMVKNGKPEPDLFLLAANKMGENINDCIIIEDSIAGITAAKRAGIDVIAFLGCKMYQNDEYIERVKKIDPNYICFNMKEVENILFL
ncbi:MAG: HAD family phosphatase [Alphaproteobacteria bacterium]|nr:HAD family phosphatase [Alphaproteobacteria bacterium]